MKTKNLFSVKAILLAAIILFTGYVSNASHLFGGEITWKCLSNGQYQFQVKMYRDCLGIPMFPISQINVYGHPSICSINLDPSLTQINDLSVNGCSYDCANPVGGAVEEFIFYSDTVSLTGVPPSTGWVFAVDDCCRNALQNLGGGGQGLTIRSIMYPYNGMDADPCFDSSPFFAEKPSVYACTGYPFSYNPNAIDTERDSLVYSWADCIDQPTSPVCTAFSAPVISFSPSPPFTVQNQLPGNPSLNSATGEINLFNFSNTGMFASCIKITAYRCGVKVAEVYRDCGFVFTTNCIVQSGSNIPPIVNSAPFLDPNTGLQTAFSDTVVAGDVVNFNLSFSELQNNIGGLGQTVELTASGDYFGSGFTNLLSGCPHPPCAILSPPPPIIQNDTASTQFFWITSCNLVNTIQACTNNIYNTFNFVFKAKDNYCPYDASLYTTISITVTGPEIQHSNDSVWIHYNGATAYQWYVDDVLIPGATDSLYVIGIPGLFYSCQVATSGGCTLSSRLYFPPVGFAEISFIRSLSIVPNPAKEKFSLHIGSADARNAEVIFTDVTGRILLSEKLQLKTGNNIFEYSTANFSSGIYFVKVGEGSGAVTRKIIVE